MSWELPPPNSPARKRWVLNLLGMLVLAGGLISAALVWEAQDRFDRQNGPGPDVLSPDDSRKYTRQAEIYYGKSGMLLEKGTRWLEEWTHGKGLAKLIGVGSLVLAGVLFAAGHEALPKPKPEQSG